MKIALQIKTEHSRKSDLVELVHQAVHLVRESGGVPRDPEFGEEDGVAYANVHAIVASIVDFWDRGKLLLDGASNSDLRKQMIVVAEGTQGWDDFLLLHHFDESQKLDDPAQH